MLKSATEFEFAYKVRDKSRPAAWVFTDGITVIPAEDECKGGDEPAPSDSFRA